MNDFAHERNVSATVIGPRCLVTGAAGFLGKALCRALVRRGCVVHAHDVRGSFDEHERIIPWKGDVRDFESVRRAAAGCATAFHTAAVMSLLGICNRATRREVESVNIGGTENVIRACEAEGVPRLVHTSTDSVCYRPHPVVAGDETMPYAERCLDIYAKTKIAAEKMVREADGRNGVRTVCLRPAGLWGDDDGCYMMTKLLIQLKTGRFVATIGGRKALADNTHIENLVQAELLVAEKLATEPSRVGGKAYFITDEEPMNLIEWFRPLIEGLGYRVPKRSIPAPIAYAAAYLMEWLHRFGGPRPFLTRLEVHNCTTSFTFRCDRARRDLGYQPTIGRDEGMARCVARYRDMFHAKGSSQ